VCIVTLGLALAALIALGIAQGQAPSLTLLVVVGAFAILATHRETFFGDETAMSGSIVVIVASVVAFTNDAWVLGPVLCCIAAGLHWAHVRRGLWSKVIVNAGATAVAAACAAVVFRSFGGSDSAVPLAMATVLAVLAYWLLNNIAIGTVLSTIAPGGVFSQVIELVRSETEMLGFALAGALCGLLFIEVGIWAGALALVLVLAAVDVLVISRPRPSSERTKHRGLAVVVARAAALVVGGGCAFAVADSVHPSAGLIAGIASAVLVMAGLTVTILHRALGSWEVRLAGGVAVADLPYAVVAAAAGVVAATIDPAIGVAVASVGLIGTGGLLAWRRHHVVTEPRIDDTELLAMLELARAERRSAPNG
jgi:hypothetical protein